MKREIHKELRIEVLITAFFPPSLPPCLPQYKLKEDYCPAPTSPTSPTSSAPLLLLQGDIVEVLDSSIREKWYVRTVGGPVLAHGWVPSNILEHIPGEDEPDFGVKRSTKGYVPITTGKQNLIIT